MDSTFEISVDSSPALREGSLTQPTITVCPCSEGWIVKKGQHQLAVLPSRADAEALAILVLDGDVLIQVLDSDGLVSALLRRTVCRRA